MFCLNCFLIIQKKKGNRVCKTNNFSVKSFASKYILAKMNKNFELSVPKL